MPTLLIDTMLLTLYVVGTASKRRYIDKHKRLRPYTRTDFDLLVAKSRSGKFESRLSGLL